jgi:hypothetical protein
MYSLISPRGNVLVDHLSTQMGAFTLPTKKGNILVQNLNGTPRYGSRSFLGFDGGDRQVVENIFRDHVLTTLQNAQTEEQIQLSYELGNGHLLERAIMLGWNEQDLLDAQAYLGTLINEWLVQAGMIDAPTGPGGDPQGGAWGHIDQDLTIGGFSSVLAELARLACSIQLFWEIFNGYTDLYMGINQTTEMDAFEATVAQFPEQFARWGTMDDILRELADTIAQEGIEGTALAHIDASVRGSTEALTQFMNIYHPGWTPPVPSGRDHPIPAGVALASTTPVVVLKAGGSGLFLPVLTAAGLIIGAGAIAYYTWNLQKANAAKEKIKKETKGVREDSLYIESEYNNLAERYIESLRAQARSGAKSQQEADALIADVRNRQRVVNARAADIRAACDEIDKTADKLSPGLPWYAWLGIAAATLGAGYGIYRFFFR